jgi:hypothetical protein
MDTFRIAITVFIILLAGVVSAQVNMEKERRGLATSGISGDIGVTYSLTLGNSELYELGITPNAVWRFQRHQIFTVNELERVSSGDGTIINKGFSHLRYNFDLTRIFVYEAFGQAQYDKSQDLTARYLAGTGLRIKIIRQDRILLAIGVTGMYEYEELSSGEITRLARSSYYISIKINDGDRLSLGATAYFQPAVSDWSDLRILTEVDLSVTIAGNIAFTHSLGYRYDSDPPAGIREYDLEIKNGLKFTF